MENFHKFFKTYPDMDMDLLNGFLRDYIEHCNDLEVGFLPIHDSSEADCCDDDPYDPYYGEYDPQLDEEYQQAFDSVVWPSSAPGPTDEKALEELRRAMDPGPYDSFDYSADIQYVVASTSYGQNETFFFMGDKDGAHGFSELGCSLAERWGNVFWNMSDRIDEAINNYFDSHDVKLIGTQHIAPDEYCSWVVNKRIYEVTKRQ